MREVSVRILHFSLDLARTTGIAEEVLTEGLSSIALVDGKRPDWFDWDDLVEIVERLERILGGPEGMHRAMRDAAPTAYPEFRAFAAVFVRPIPLFTFTLTRLLPTMYRNVQVKEVEAAGENRIRWQLTIPDEYRPSAAFHRSAIGFAEVFPRHLDLPEARVLEAEITPTTGRFLAEFPPADPLTVRGARAVSSAASVLAAQLDEAFEKIAATLRERPSATPPATPNGGHRDWAERLALSPRQRDVFALLVEGRANKEIAATLQCSERNVEFHVGRILRSARVSSRAELLVKVLGTRA